MVPTSVSHLIERAAPGQALRVYRVHRQIEVLAGAWGPCEILPWAFTTHCVTPKSRIGLRDPIASAVWNNVILLVQRTVH